MSDRFVDLGDGFWTVRGIFRIGGTGKLFMLRVTIA